MSITCELVPEELGLRAPLFAGAFLNWPDASMGASGAVRYLVEALHAAPLATWDGDEFYDFVELRPVSRVVPPRDRRLIWPQAEFWVAREVPKGDPLDMLRGGTSSNDTRSLILFLAHEPRLRWRTYSRELAAFAQRCQVTQAVFFGSAWADVPHTRPPIVTGWATEATLRTRLEALGVPFSAYQGPSSMQSAAIEAFREAGIASASLFSNGPHYLPVPNANLSLALLRRAAAAFGLRLDLGPLEEAGQALIRQANAAIEERSELREHIRQLEQQFDEQATPFAPGEVSRSAAAREQAERDERQSALNVDPQEVVRELEEFLRRRAGGQPPGGGDEPPSGEGGPLPPASPGGEPAGPR